MSRNFELLCHLQRERDLFQRAFLPDGTNRGSRKALPSPQGDERPTDAAASSVPDELESARLAGCVSNETRQLVQRLFLASGFSAPRTLVFCRVERNGKRNSICAQVADLLASNTEQSVCIVDANLTAPWLHTHFGVENQKGLVEALLDPGPVEEFTRPLEGGRLQLMTAGAGSRVTNLRAMLASGRLRTRIAELEASFDYVLVDAPPATSDSMTPSLAALADGLILVVEPRFTSRQTACEAKENIKAAGGRVLGVMLSQRKLRLPSWISEAQGSSKPVWNF